MNPNLQNLVISYLLLSMDKLSDISEPQFPPYEQ